VRERELKWKEEAAKRAIAERKWNLKSPCGKKYPGIEGEVFESTAVSDVYFDYDSHGVRPRDVKNLQTDCCAAHEASHCKDPD